MCNKFEEMLAMFLSADNNIHHIYVASFCDQDGYYRPIASAVSEFQLNIAIDVFKTEHKDNSYWQLNFYHIDFVPYIT